MSCNAEGLQLESSRHGTLPPAPELPKAADLRLGDPAAEPAALAMTDAPSDAALVRLRCPEPTLPYSVPDTGQLDPPGISAQLSRQAAA